MAMKSKMMLRILFLISGAILLSPFAVLAQTPIDCGQTLAGTISAAAEKDSYTFTASANDGITIRARKTSGTVTPYIELYGPSGALITGAASKIDRTLTQTGTYRIDIRDQNNTNTGDYLLYWERMNNPCNATPISCAQVLTGSIGTSVNPPPWKIYTFTASAGDAVSIRSLKTSGASFISYLELYGPNGSYITYAYNNSLERMLTTAGTYTVLIRDYYNANAGDFFLTYQVMSNPCNATPINCAEVASSSIGGPAEMDVYTFTGSANDKVIIQARGTSGDLNPVVELYNPSGSRISNYTLTASGTYKIIVRDSSYSNTGDYLLYWQRMNNPCNGTSVSCGQVLTDSIGASVDPPPWKLYTCTGSVGDSVSIRSARISAGTFIPYMELYKPDGTYINYAYNNPLNQVLSTAGTYKILIRDYYNTYAGDFFLSYQVMNNPCNATPIDCGQVVSSAIDGVGEMDVYTFTGSANDEMMIQPRSTSGNLNPVVELYNPSGSRITDYTLTTSGTYKIIVRDGSYVNTGNYLVYLQRLNNPCNATTINCGQIVTGSIGTSVNPPPWKAYTFTGSAGDAVSFTATKTSGANFIPLMELYKPDGTFITSKYNAPLVTTLTAAGIYKMLVRDYFNAYEGDYTLKFQKNNNYCSEVTVTSPNGNEVVEGGSQFTITWTYSTPRNITSQEIRLSTDGGETFPNVVTTGLPGIAQSFDWTVPTDVSRVKARIRVIVTDDAGLSTPDDSDTNFVIFPAVQRTYVYDELGRLIQIIYEDGSKVNYTYDAAGNRITLTQEPGN